MNREMTRGSQICFGSPSLLDGLFRGMSKLRRLPRCLDLIDQNPMSIWNYLLDPQPEITRKWISAEIHTIRTSLGFDI